MKKKQFHTLRSKITLLTVSITLCITIFVTSICFFTFRSLLKQSLLQSTEFGLKIAATNITTILHDISALTTWGNHNSAITNYLSDDTSNRSLALTAYTRLKEEYQNSKYNEYITRILVGSDNNSFIQVVKNTNDGSYLDAANLKNSTYYKLLLDAPTHTWIGLTKDPLLTSGDEIIPMIRPIFSAYNNNRIGFIYITISPSLITDILTAYDIPSDSYLYITIGEHTYMLQGMQLVDVSLQYTFHPYKDTEIIDTETIATNQLLANKNEINQKNHPKQTILTYPCGIDDWYISQSLSEDIFITQTNTYYFLLFLICFIVISLGIFLTYYINRIINPPMIRMKQKMIAIANGDFSYDPSIESPDELGQIGAGINHLATDVIELMEKRIHDEKKQKELEYQILQSQINPHFLHNTLNSIKWMATIQHAPGIAEMTTALSLLLKSVSNGTSELIPLKEELELIKHYMVIQKYRYGGGLSITYDIKEEALLLQTIPKFTLQPIIENAIFHGIEAKGKNGQICITIEPTSSESLSRAFYIHVYDNGVGISEQEIQQILSNEEDSSGFFKKIGISNVNARIKYSFGETYGITIQSKKQEFTKITITLPRRLQ